MATVNESQANINVIDAELSVDEIEFNPYSRCIIQWKYHLDNWKLCASMEMPDQKVNESITPNRFNVSFIRQQKELATLVANASIAPQFTQSTKVTQLKTKTKANAKPPATPDEAKNRGGKKQTRLTLPGVTGQHGDEKEKKNAINKGKGIFILKEGVRADQAFPRDLEKPP